MTQRGRGIQSQPRGHELFFCRERKNKSLKEAVKPKASPTPSLGSVLNRVWKEPPHWRRRQDLEGGKPEEER